MLLPSFTVGFKQTPAGIFGGDLKGAVVFGRSDKFGKWWPRNPKLGPKGSEAECIAEDNKQSLQDSITEEVFHDSGLGSEESPSAAEASSNKSKGAKNVAENPPQQPIFPEIKEDGIHGSAVGSDTNFAAEPSSSKSRCTKDLLESAPPQLSRSEIQENTVHSGGLGSEEIYSLEEALSSQGKNLAAPSDVASSRRYLPRVFISSRLSVRKLFDKTIISPQSLSKNIRQSRVFNGSNAPAIPSGKGKEKMICRDSVGVQATGT